MTVSIPDEDRLAFQRGLLKQASRMAKVSIPDEDRLAFQLAVAEAGVAGRFVGFNPR